MQTLPSSCDRAGDVEIAVGGNFYVSRGWLLWQALLHMVYRLLCSRHPNPGGRSTLLQMADAMWNVDRAGQPIFVES